MVGTISLLWSFYPIVAYNISSHLVNRKNISPVPSTSLATSLKKGLTVYNEKSAPYYSSYLKDFTKVADWFPEKPQKLTRKTNISKYFITIPKLGIVNEMVRVGGNDLSDSLVQYGNKVLPGEIGNSTVLGHSTLPQLYKKNDQKSIFTYLPTTERGDTVTVTVNDFTYEYVVYDMFVVKPEEIWVLNEKADESVLTLITCVPPGTYWERLVVKARLTKI
jgi:sortase A